MISNLSYAKDYCSADGKKISITLMMPKGLNKDSKIILLKTSHDFLKKVIKPGDHINFSIAKKDVIKPIVNRCFPGCPPSGFFGQVLGLGTSCNPTIMQKDKKIFERDLFGSFPKLYNEEVKDGITDIFSSLESISKFNKSQKYNEVYIISMMNPFNEENIKESKIDSLFLDLAQNDKLPKALPNATYIGITQNSKLILFWNDVFKSLNMKFKYE